MTQDLPRPRFLHENEPDESDDPKKLRSRKNQRKPKKQTETEEAQDSALVARVFALPEAVGVSLKGRLNRHSLFLYCRALRAMEHNGQPLIQEHELSTVFGSWWLAAEPKLPKGADYQIYFGKFKYTFRKTRSPLRIDPLEDAIRFADAHMPAEALGPVVGRLALVCQRLQEITRPDPFFITSRQTAKIIGSKDAYEALGAIAHLEDLGIIRCVERGAGRKANRYQFTKHN